MIECKKVKLHNLDDLFPLLIKINNPRISYKNWKELFSLNWSNKDFSGYGLFYKDKIVGFLGLLFSKQKINGKEFEFANMTTWIVEEEYREHSLKLLLPIVRSKDLVITNYSASPKVQEILTKLGFQHKQNDLFFIPIHPFKFSKQVKIIFNIQEIKPHLIPEHEKLCDSHNFEKTIHCLIKHNNEYSYFIGAKKNRIPVIQIHYIYNQDLLNKFQSNVLFLSLKVYKVVGIMYSNQIIKNKLRFSLPFLNLKQISLLKSDQISIDHIDNNLFSELPILAI